MLQKRASEAPRDRHCQNGFPQPRISRCPGKRGVNKNNARQKHQAVPNGLNDGAWFELPSDALNRDIDVSLQNDTHWLDAEEAEYPHCGFDVERCRIRRCCVEKSRQNKANEQHSRSSRCNCLGKREKPISEQVMPYPTPYIYLMLARFTV